MPTKNREERGGEKSLHICCHLKTAYLHLLIVLSSTLSKTVSHKLDLKMNDMRLDVPVDAQYCKTTLLTSIVRFLNCQLLAICHWH